MNIWKGEGSTIHRSITTSSVHRKIDELIKIKLWTNNPASDLYTEQFDRTYHQSLLKFVVYFWVYLTRKHHSNLRVRSKLSVSIYASKVEKKMYHNF